MIKLYQHMTLNSQYEVSWLKQPWNKNNKIILTGISYTVVPRIAMLIRAAKIAAKRFCRYAILKSP